MREVIGCLVRPVRPLTREGDDDDRDPAQPSQENHLDRDVDDERRGTFAGDPAREGGHPGAETRMMQRRPVQDPERGHVVTRGRDGVVVTRQVHPFALPARGLGQGAEPDDRGAEVRSDRFEPAEVTAALVVDVVPDHAAPRSVRIVS